MYANSMKNNFMRTIILLLLISLKIIYAQEKCNLLIDERTGSPMLTGLVDKKVFLDSSEYKPFSNWFRKEYESYNADSTVADSLKNLNLENITIDVIMGTWCSDSRREIPRLIKILDAIQFNSENLKMICVDRNKSAGEIDLSNYDIKLIPTIVIKRNEKEIGRIIETPSVSVEKDLLNIINQY